MKFKLYPNILLDPVAPVINTGGAPGMPQMITGTAAPTTTSEPVSEPAAPSSVDESNTPANTSNVETPPEDDTMGDFNALLGKTHQIPSTPAKVTPAKPIEPAKVVEPAKETVEDETPIQQPTTLPNGLPAIKLPVAKSLARDFSDLPPETHSMFKNMSNEAYNTLKPIYLESKKHSAIVQAKDAEITQLKTSQPSNGLPASYLEHEAAYTLTPEYNNVINQADRLKLEHAHWREQLRIVKAGGDWQGLALDGNGNLVKTAKQPFNADVEDDIRANMMKAEQYHGQAEQMINNLAITHKQKVQQGHQQLQQIENQFFPFLANPSPEDKQMMEQAISGIPEAFRPSKLSTLVGKAYVTCIKLQKALDEATSPSGNIVTKQAAIAEDAKRAGPNSGKLGSAPAAQPVKEEDDMAAFTKLIEAANGR